MRGAKDDRAGPLLEISHAAWCLAAFRPRLDTPHGISQGGSLPSSCQYSADRGFASPRSVNQPYHSPDKPRACLGVGVLPSPLRSAPMPAIRASISDSHSRCFADASTAGTAGPLLIGASERLPYNFAYASFTSSGMRLCALKLPSGLVVSLLSATRSVCSARCSRHGGNMQRFQ
jgi:hypothetical protein